MNTDTKQVTINLMELKREKDGAVALRNGSPTRVFQRCIIQHWPVEKLIEFDNADSDRRQLMIKDTLDEYKCDDAEVWSSPSLSTEGNQVPMRTYSLKPRGFQLKKDDETDD